MRRVVFYSWQSDLPNATNRGFIQRALEGAARSIGSDQSIDIEPVIDRDTAGVPGSPDITGTIFDKIDRTDAFVCDVSITNSGASGRLTANPNVLVELGYAMKALGPGRIIMVLNRAFGPPEQLPFDLRLRRVVCYDMPDASNDRATERKKLEGVLAEALRTILSDVDTPLPRDLMQRDRPLLLASGPVPLVEDRRHVDWSQNAWDVEIQNVGADLAVGLCGVLLPPRPRPKEHEPTMSQRYFLWRAQPLRPNDARIVSMQMGGTMVSGHEKMGGHTLYAPPRPTLGEIQWQGKPTILARLTLTYRDTVNRTHATIIDYDLLYGWQVVEFVPNIPHDLEYLHGHALGPSPITD